MNATNRLMILTIVTVFFVTTYVAAQMRLDTRTYRTGAYDPRNIGNSQGYALDRNPQLGSDGRNTAGRYAEYTQNPGSFTDISRTRGLTAFQGNTATISETFDSKSSTTGAINKFNQKAVSVADVMGAQAAIYNPKVAAAYYSQGETVMTADQAVRFANLNVAPIRGNSNVVADMQQQNQANQLMEDMTPQQSRQLSSLLYLQDTPYGYKAATAVPGTLPAATNAQDILQVQQAMERMGYAQGTFGQINQYDRTSLANEITQFDQSEEQTDRNSGMIDSRVGNGPITGSPVASIDAPAITGKPPVRDDFLFPQEGPKDKTATDTTKSLDDSGAMPAEDKMGFNQDAFHDLRVAIQQKAADERNVQEQKRKETQEKEAQELDKVIDKDYEKNAEQEELTNLDLKRDRELRKQMIVELDTKNDVVLKNLAGNSRDLFNRYMNNAKRALSKGRYYAASQQYELAAMSDSRNPLPWLGGSLAKFAACEWSVAGFRLKTALEMYPQLMNVKLELKSLLPDLDVAQQLNLLENWIMAMEPQPNVLLLAAYMQYQAGNFAGARRHAQAILEYKLKVTPIIKETAEDIMKKTASAEGK